MSLRDRLLDTESAAELLEVQPSTIRWWADHRQVARRKDRFGLRARRRIRVAWMIHTLKIVPAGVAAWQRRGVSSPPIKTTSFRADALIKRHGASTPLVGHESTENKFIF